MKIDTYSKGILTIIAFCLVLIVAKEFDVFPKAMATEPANTPIIIPGTAVNPNGSLNVVITGFESPSEMDVNISGISTNDELDVNIDEIGGGYVSHGGPISVDVN